MSIEALLKLWYAYFNEEENPAVLKVLASWIQSELKAGSVSDETTFLKHLNAVVIEKHPRQYKRLPGVNELSTYKYEVWHRYNDEIQRNSTAKQIPELYMSAGEVGDMVEKLAQRLQYKETAK